MALLIKDYDFGLPLKTIEDLDKIETNLLMDDKYTSCLVRSIPQFRQRFYVKTRLMLEIFITDWLSKI